MRDVLGDFAYPLPVGTEQRSRLLVVDDDQRLCASLEALLLADGYFVEKAYNGRQALASLESGNFDLMLLDLRMPLLDGHQVLARVQQLESPPNIIVVSGETTFDDAQRVLREGADDFIRKPYIPQELLASVSTVLAKRQLKQENRIYQKRLADSEHLHRFIVDHSPDIIYMLDENGCFTFLNHRTELLLGYTRNELMGEHFSRIVHPEDLLKATSAMDERRTGDRATRNLELRLRRMPGSEAAGAGEPDLEVELSAIGLYHTVQASGGSGFRGSIGVARDVSARKQAEAKLRHQLYHDVLTGLPNRALFNDRVKQAIAQSKRRADRFAVMCLDLDRFKVINDTLGHLVGDQLLQLVSRRLMECLRESDTLARVGGDEFNLLLPAVASWEDAASIARKLLDSLWAPFQIEGRELFISMSIGIAMYPDNGGQSELLIKNADMAMYDVKARGKNDFGFFSPEMQEHYDRHLSVEHGLRRAIMESQFEVHYQPQLNLATGEVQGLESLLRWRADEHGFVPNTHFISVAEESGLMVDIGEWLFERLCDDASSWLEQGCQLPVVAYNVSASQLAQQDFCDMVLDSWLSRGLPGQGLEVEITENALLRDMERSSQKLRRLAAHGVRIAIDDFGTGYSSMSYLQQLPLHTLKIDRSFICNVQSLEERASILDAIVAMGHGMNLRMVGEGVETEVQLRYLQDLGCQLAQGFLFSPAIDAEAMARMLSGPPDLVSLRATRQMFLDLSQQRKPAM